MSWSLLKRDSSWTFWDAKTESSGSFRGWVVGRAGSQPGNAAYYKYLLSLTQSTVPIGSEGLGLIGQIREKLFPFWQPRVKSGPMLGWYMMPNVSKIVTWNDSNQCNVSAQCSQCKLYWSVQLALRQSPSNKIFPPNKVEADCFCHKNNIVKIRKGTEEKP